MNRRQNRVIGLYTQERCLRCCAVRSGRPNFTAICDWRRNNSPPARLIDTIFPPKSMHSAIWPKTDYRTSLKNKNAPRGIPPVISTTTDNLSKCCVRARLAILWPTFDCGKQEIAQITTLSTFRRDESNSVRLHIHHDFIFR